MWNVTACFQMKPDNDTQFCQRKYNPHESKAGESRWSVYICTRRNEGLEIQFRGKALPGMLEARGERDGETLGYGSLNPYSRIMSDAALTLQQKSAQNEFFYIQNTVMTPRSKWLAGYWMIGQGTECWMCSNKSIEEPERWVTSNGAYQQVWHPEFNSWGIHSRKREQIFTSCPLTFI